MNFRKILYVFIPLISLLTIFGVAFSIWVFDVDTVKDVNNGINIKINDEIKVGNLKVISCPDLVIFSEGVGKLEDLTDGIEFYNYSENNKLNESVFVKDSRLIVDYEIIDSNDSVNYLSNCSMFINIDPNNSGTESLKNYITLTSKYTDCSKPSGYDFKKYIKILNKGEIYPLGGFRFEMDLNEAIQYVDLNKKPNTIESYNNLFNEIKTLKNLIIEIKFRIEQRWIDGLIKYFYL